MFGPKRQPHVSPSDSIYDSLQITRDKENILGGEEQSPADHSSGPSAKQLQINELKVQKQKSNSKKKMIDNVKKKNAKKSNSNSRSKRSQRNKKTKKGKKHDVDSM